MELLKELCQTSAVPGQEQRLGAIVERELDASTHEGLVDEYIQRLSSQN